MLEPRAFTPGDLAERWGCTERHVRNLISRGELQFFRLGGTRRGLTLPRTRLLTTRSADTKHGATKRRSEYVRKSPAR